MNAERKMIRRCVREASGKDRAFPRGNTPCSGGFLCRSPNRGETFGAFRKKGGHCHERCFCFAVGRSFPFGLRESLLLPQTLNLQGTPGGSGRNSGWFADVTEPPSGNPEKLPAG